MPTAALNDTELYYVVAGSDAAPPCLVMHGGLGMDHSYLHPALDPLGDVLRLVYYDHRGNGRSGRPPSETITMAQLADDADALLAHLGAERVTLLGHSYGGFTALEFALRHPQRLSHLILVDTAPAMDYGAEIEANVERKATSPDVIAARKMPVASDEDLAAKLNGMAPLYFHSFDRAVADRLFGRMVCSATAFKRGGALTRSYDVSGRLGEIACPTLILVGWDDFVCPLSQAERLHHGIPGSELVVFERSGHMPYAEEPDAFFAAVREWLARH